MKRIFIVGIARSGTTLLQSIVGNHAEICTFPETHFFSNTIPKQKLLRLIHKITPAHQQLVKSFFDEHQLKGYREYDGRVRNMKDWTNYLINLLDNIAAAEKKEIWLEKTPMHLYFIDLIERNTDNCYFIHTLREPRANIAALYDVSKKHPTAFKQGSIEKSITRYKVESSIAQRHLTKKNHLAVYYEDLVTNPSSTIESVFSFLDLSPTDDILNYKENVDNIVSQDESWKSNNNQALELKDRIQERLTPEELLLVEKEIKKFHLGILKRYES